MGSSYLFTIFVTPAQIDCAHNRLICKMEFTTKDLELLANEQNKELYSTMYDLVVKEFENALNNLDVKDMTQIKQDTMGTCGIYISSLVEHLHTLRDMMEKGFIESGGAIATAAWERALTLRKIIIDPVANAQIVTDHKKAKTTPWTILAMVKDVITHERQLTQTALRPFEIENYYLQYTFLSSIKHGNPYTISYLNREELNDGRRLFDLAPNNSAADKDLKIYIKMLAADNALDALHDFSKQFKTNIRSVTELRKAINGVIGRVELFVPTIFMTTPEEMKQPYWDHLMEIERLRAAQSRFY